MNILEIFTELDLQPFTDLLPALESLLNENIVHWQGNQICLTTTTDRPDDYTLGTGSLVLDWDKKVDKKSVGDTTSLHIPMKQTRLEERDFSILCSQFNGTVFQEVYSYLLEKYAIGRLRLMQLQPKTCLSWHVDTTPRIHYPIKTQPGCIMVVDERACHLTQDKWWLVDTTRPHSVLNGSLEYRIHLVGAIIG